MRNDILFIVLIFAAFAGGYFTGRHIGRDEIEKKYTTAPSRHTVTVKQDSVVQPKRSAEVRNDRPVSAQHKVDADSVFQQEVAAGIDSARSMFAYYTAPIDTMVVFDTVGSVHVTYRPLERRMKITLEPSPVRLITVTVTDSFFVRIPEEREWWRTPAYIAGAFAIGWLSHDVLKE